jgi:hypothetical protein
MGMFYVWHKRRGQSTVDWLASVCVCKRLHVTVWLLGSSGPGWPVTSVPGGDQYDCPSDRHGRPADQ